MAFSLSKRKSLENAQKYVQKGSYDKALKEYEKHLKAEPDDTNARLKLGDLYIKRGNPSAAIEEYSRVASLFSKGGFDAKAVAIYKQILKIDPTCLDAHINLGDHFQRMGLGSEALRQFQEAVGICQERGLKREAFDLLKRVAQLDPGNVPNRLNLADLLQREGLTSEAHQEYRSLLEEVEGGDDPEMVLHVCKHMMKSFPDQESPIQICAAAQIKLGQLDEAAQLLRAALARFTDSIELRESLVRLHEARGDAAAVGSAYREIAELYKRRGDNDKARDILQRFVPVEAFGDDRDPETSPSLLLSDEADDLGGELDLDLVVDDEAPGQPPSPVEGQTDGEVEAPAAPQSELAAEPVSDLGGGDAEELMAEARVSLEFGDPDAARQSVERALELDPEAEGARELLAKISGGDPAELGELRPPQANSTPDAVDPDQGDRGSGFRTADLGQEPDFDTLPDIELVLEDEQDGDTGFGSVEPPSGLGFVETEPSDPDAKAAALDAAADQLADLDADLSGSGLDEDVDAVGLDELVTEEPEPSKDTPKAGAEPELDKSWGEQSTRIEDFLEEAEFYLEQGMLAEAEALYRRVLKVAPQHPQANLRVGEIEAQRGERDVSAQEPEPTSGRAEAEALGDTQVEEDVGAALSGEEEFDLDADELDASGADGTEASPQSEADAEAAAPAQPESEAVGPGVEAEEIITVQAEDTEPSIEVEPLVEEEPGPTELPAEEVITVQPEDTVPSARAPEQPMTLAAEGDDEGFDLAAELADESAPPKGTSDEEFQEIFSAFKKGIQEQVGEDEAEAHYDLAIAYKEMGLLSDAVEQLELVCRSKAMQIEGLSLMATCELELGQAEQAAGHLSQALCLAGGSGEWAVALRYDLGEALLAAGRKGEALDAFEKVRAADAGFREVQDRIAELTD